MSEDEINARLYRRPSDASWWADLGGEELAGPYATKREAEVEVEALFG